MPALSPAPPSAAYVLRVLDVGLSIDVDEAARRLAGARVTRGPSTLRGPLGAGAGGILLASRPVDIACGEVTVGGVRAEARVRLLDFGIAAVRFQIPLADVARDTLIPLAARVEVDAGFDAEARRLWAALAGSLGPALHQPSPIDFIEDYTVFVLPREPGTLSGRDETLARILLGEDSPRALSREAIEEPRRRAIRYFDDDLVVVDYDAAVVVDPQCSTELVDIFEIATAHLLELRYYDHLLSRALTQMATEAAALRGASWLSRSPFHALAERAVMLVLELSELTDRFERSITLLGDTYSVQVYRAAAERFRIPEATAAVHAKLEAVARSAEVLNDHVQTRRGLALEILVILLIAFEVGMAVWRR